MTFIIADFFSVGLPWVTPGWLPLTEEIFAGHPALPMQMASPLPELVFPTFWPR